MGRLTHVILALGGMTIFVPYAASSESGFGGRLKTGFEVERKKCTSCVPSEYENEIEVTVIDLALQPRSRKDLSYGLQLEYDTESDGAILGSGRADIVNNSGLGLWVRKDFGNGLWARAQAAAETEEALLDLGGRLGYSAEFKEIFEVSLYADLERRFPIGASSNANQGTYLEAGLELEWDWGRYGAWTEIQASKWFFDTGSAADEREVTLQPGLWMELGDTDHRGLLWVELEHFEVTGARQEDEYSSELGFGVEFSLENQSELMVGFTAGKEREKIPGQPDERMTVYGMEVTFQRRF